MSILHKIDSLVDFKLLDRRDLPILAEEIRQLIIGTVSETGGHLAANLGVVELSMALHRVFNSPEDKIIWDVGHQCYTHKILTDRRQLFHTLRQYGGLSGFPKQEESPHDMFNTGHSSTSISAAVGMCIARDLSGGSYKVIAVIGDGALTGGMAFEALNHAGALKKDLLVILNDNEMSISPNVGAFSIYLNRLITGQLYNKMKREIETAIRSIPQIGGQVAKIAGRLDEAIKSLVVPGIMFEELGFKYIGPIPGHNINNLIEALEAVKRFQKPTLLHIVTKKGKGYVPAEKNPSVYHSAGPFVIETGHFNGAGKSSAPTYTEVFSRTLVQMAKDNPKIVAITAAMPEGTGLDRFAGLFPDRFFDVGIAEEHALTLAAGMACQGFHPVIAIYSTFLQRAYDQILHDVCLQNLPVIIAIDRAGLVGEDGPTHHGAFDLSYLRTMPNMTIMAPKDESELQVMLSTAFWLSSPVAIRYPRGRGVGGRLETSLNPLLTGEGELLQAGGDLTLIAIGSMVYEALAAAEQARHEGILAQVINARFVKPLDKTLIVRSVCSTGRVITVEENSLVGGFGSAVLELLEEQDLSGAIRIRRLGLPDKFVPAGSREFLMRQLGLDRMGILEAIRKICSPPIDTASPVSATATATAHSWMVV